MIQQKDPCYGNTSVPKGGRGEDRMMHNAQQKDSITALYALMKGEKKTGRFSKERKGDRIEQKDALREGDKKV